MADGEHYVYFGDRRVTDVDFSDRDIADPAHLHLFNAGTGQACR